MSCRFPNSITTTCCQQVSNKLATSPSTCVIDFGLKPTEAILVPAGELMRYCSLPQRTTKCTKSRIKFQKYFQTINLDPRLSALSNVWYWYTNSTKCSENSHWKYARGIMELLLLLLLCKSPITIWAEDFLSRFLPVVFVRCVRDLTKKTLSLSVHVWSCVRVALCERVEVTMSSSIVFPSVTWPRCF